MPEPQTIPSAAAQSTATSRTIRGADGRPWRVTAVRPNDVLGERRLATGDRRMVPIETLPDPPVLQRRSGRDRRVANERRHPLPGALLPPAWRDGWLLFETDGEVRRLAPIPTGWARMADAELAGVLDQAAGRGD